MELFGSGSNSFLPILLLLLLTNDGCGDDNGMFLIIILLLFCQNGKEDYCCDKLH